MPAGDRRGPLGFGPKTGRGAGFCSGFSAPGFMNRFVRGRMGLGRRRGFGRGFGVGYRTAPVRDDADRGANLSEHVNSLKRQLDSIQQKINRLQGK